MLPSKSGRFRFVGAADDVLMVRFNHSNVFDHGAFLGTAGLLTIPIRDALLRKHKDITVERKLRYQYPMKIPANYYQYENSPWWKEINGFATGAEFEVKEGDSYPIQIFLGNTGLLFGGILLIEEIGAHYEKTAAGFPILPLFRTDATLPTEDLQQLPPFNPNGPIWKVNQ